MLEAIPFNRPTIMGDEIWHMEQAVRSGHSASGGEYSRRSAEFLQGKCGAAGVLLTTSCTDALELSAMLLGIGPGDVVVVPSFTFTSTALAFARAGATIRFCDIDAASMSLDPDDVESVMDETVRAIVVVHYAGIPADVDRLCQIAERYGAELIEDNAHGLFGSLNGRPLGSFGRMSAVSFHETKNFICGEGGAIVLNEESDVGLAHICVDKGTNRQAFLAGNVDKYTWQGMGSSFGLSEILAAFLWGQFEQYDQIRAERRRVSDTYRALLEPVAEQVGIELPQRRLDTDSADHMFYVLVPRGTRSHVIDSMRSAQVNPTFHYVPLHSAPAGRSVTDSYRECPVTNDVSERLLRLPFFNTLTESHMERVVASLIDSLAQR